MTRLMAFMMTIGSIVVPTALAAEEMASADEVEKVNQVLAQLNCQAGEVEKESAMLFEIDDAVCEVGQYDIKLDGDFVVTSMTFDGPIDEDGEEVEASEEEIAKVNEVLAAVGCETDDVEKESAALFEIDDAACSLGQFDIKIDGEGTLLSMTFDGPIDED